MSQNTERVPLFAEGYQPEAFSILNEVVTGYKADTIEAMESIRRALNSIGGVFTYHELPPQLELQVLALRMDLARQRMHKYLRAKQALDMLEVPDGRVA